MTAPARLLALRLQGFKSFAERTLVEFGPGISAVVGPNGSGKSNLADALRWALGEQGRSLRVRRSEDVIFAGSERRAALGMADVTIVLDNGDGLLPVEYASLELGRRLYRSGENDYLLNRQRIRLRDLVDLLDAANLADNAFLFIGQGMVDQALSLRPEERRPLFEEVAGVRRHERRRRRAEAQLLEAEDNLGRVEDILAELRPQARRLKVQAEQQATRWTAGEDLAAALLVSAHARWHEAAGRVASTATARGRMRVEADRAMEGLTAAERAVAVITAEIDVRVATETRLREAHDAARGRLTELQLREARSASDLGAARRDRERLVAERAAAEAEIASQRRILAVALPQRDVEAESALADADRALSEALTELATIRAASQARGDELAAVRRAEAARHAELETARRRFNEAERHLAEETSLLDEAGGRLLAAEATLETARSALAEAVAAESRRVAAREAARVDADAREAARVTAEGRLAEATAALSVARGRAASMEAELEAEERRGIARAARRRGGRRVDEGLQVAADLRAAVEAVLGDVGRAYLVARSAVEALAAERGVLVVGERIADRPAPLSSRERVVVDRAIELGGGRLDAAILHDAVGVARRLMGHAVWLPDLASALELQSELPAGWMAVTRDGSAVVGPLAIRAGRPDPMLRLRADLAAARADVDAGVDRETVLEAEAQELRAAAGAARGTVAEARTAEAAATTARRTTEETERVAGREVEAATRERAWHEAQAARLTAERDRARAALAALEAVPTRDAGASEDAVAADPDAATAWEDRVVELRARRDRWAAAVAELDAARRDAEARRARAEATLAIAEGRLAGADRELAVLATSEQVHAAEGEALAAEVLRLAGEEARARDELEALRAAEVADRGRLAAAEADAAACREGVRTADERLRSAEVAGLEARLAQDAIRENILVELAGLGETGLRKLEELVGAAGDTEREPGDEAEAGHGSDDGSDTADDVGRLERLLDGAALGWATSTPPPDPPSASRLASLRRRYHDLGAGNPFAVEEYEAVRSRLGSLEAQQRDLQAAIAGTRRLIAELDALVAGQFRTTFRALETAFDRRFQQLFAGGFARLSLTEPDDLSSTGVEIVARPPGKKPQALPMLSGGERALTAVALLFAMLEVRPVPFCVLDEVDAALDEANVGRFTQALRQLADATQFVVITHNRGTIETADALYGVTVGDDSVSRVISLRLEEARAIAERAEADRVAAG